ncbi:MAG: glycerophosphodiester phosphodiesterase [Acidobacteriaceae bacterium]|nr:glycerophosphodiester phosphodiesterase [Acidobacteriaceae bacterium]
MDFLRLRSVHAARTISQLVLRPPLLLGHRGARASPIPENTLASFELALSHACDGFEFDVRLAACGCAVICHDPEYHGMPLSKIYDTKSVDLLRLEEVLAAFSKQAFLNIELKVPGLSSELLLALHQSPPEKGYVVSSFLPDVLLDVHTRNSSIPLGFICDKAKNLPLWRDLPVQYVIPQHPLIDRELIRDVHDADKFLFAWTVNERSSMQRLAEWGVDGIISDDTELLVKTLRPPQTRRGSLA